jgi:hypothetical protein
MSDEAGCRVCREGVPHPDHIEGYGAATKTWPNEDFRPLVHTIPKNKMAEFARRTREFNADTLS